MLVAILGGVVVVDRVADGLIVACYGGWNGRERKCEDGRNRVLDAGFLADFGPKFLHFWTMKIKSIYRRWKMDILSFMVPNLGPWIDPKASQPLVQSSNDELSVLCRKMVGRVGFFGAVSSPLKPRSAQTVCTSM